MGKQINTTNRSTTEITSTTHTIETQTTKVFRNLHGQERVCMAHHRFPGSYFVLLSSTFFYVCTSSVHKDLTF